MKYYPDKFEIEVACGKENGMLIPELEKLGVEVHIIPDLVREISPIKDLKAYLHIRKLIRQNQYDIVHVHSSKAGFLGRLAARCLGVNKIIYTVHGWWPIEQYNGIKRKIFILAERFASHFCEKIVLLGKNDLGKAREWKIGKQKQYVIINNAIIPIEDVQKGKLRKELGLDGSTKIVGNVARLDPPKNPLRFLNIAQRVLNEKKDVAFVWIGGSVVDDYYGNLVKEWLEKHPQEAEKIYFLPFRKDAIELMADFDVFLLTSDTEGMPLVVLEALNQGIPVVSTDVGCVREMGKLIFTGRSTENLSKNVINILTNQALVANSRYESKFNDFIENYAKLYLGA
jgi:glycosyltransferase involved in cell wall biosynthesis